MKTAIFDVALVDTVFPAGTPTPTTIRARAEGSTQKVATLTWFPGSDAVSIPISFNEAVEAGTWQGFVDLLAETVVLSTIGPVTFLIPQAPVTVTYRAPGGFTVAVG